MIKGFPRTRADFEWLDSTEMGPNRYNISKQSDYLKTIDEILSVNHLFVLKKNDSMTFICIFEG